MKNFITGKGDDLAAVGAWIRLAHARGGPGAAGARKLLARFGLPQHIFAASRSALLEVLSARHVDALLAAPTAATLALIERTSTWLAEPGKAHHLLTLADAAYPPALLTIADPPLLLYAIGQPALLKQPAVAVVGSRNASRQGLLHAEQFSEALSRAGQTIVSGMALGIDSAAHEGGLRGCGSTVAVIGTGIDQVYPWRNRTLAERIARRGCIVSEYSLGMPPLAVNFPRRNRLISGLAGAVLVVEAALRSGSLITARVAADQGRDVLAIPGSIHSPMSKGCHALIKQGAKLVESVQDVLEELADYGHGKGAGIGAAVAPAPEPGAITGALLKHMGYDPITLDALALCSGRSTASLQGELLMLELEGRVALLPGGAYCRIA
ncbi:MAG: processing protein DprA [Herbaspirillum sp.]|nr:processing protein DprA [Herbaspirillum sp.]